MCRKTKIAVGRRSGRNAEQATFKQKSRASFLYDPVMYVTRGCTIVTYSIDAFRLSWEGPNLWRSLQAAAWVPFRHVKYWMCEVTSICRTECRHKNMPDWKDNGSRRLLEVTGFILHNTCTQKRSDLKTKKIPTKALTPTRITAYAISCLIFTALRWNSYLFLFHYWWSIAFQYVTRLGLNSILISLILQLIWSLK